MNEAKERHDLLFEEILANNIFEPDQILYDEKADLTGIDLDMHHVAFFQVIRGVVYFLLINGTFMCIHSDGGVLNKQDVDRDVRIQSIKSISFEKFLEVVPKEVANKYLYHLDFFQKHLQVIKI